MMSNALIYLLQLEPTAGSGNTVRTPLEGGHHGNEVALVTEHHFSPNPGNWSFQPTSSSVRVAHFQGVCMHNGTSSQRKLEYPAPHFL